MKSIKPPSTLILGFLIIILFACTGDSEQLDVLMAESSKLYSGYEQQLVETKSAIVRADSLQSIVNDLEGEVQELKGQAPVYNASEADEEAIEALVRSLHQGWASMFQTDNTNDVLKHFITEYTTSAIRINAENVPSVRRRNDSNFEEFLHALVATNHVALTFGETKFMYTEVRATCL